MSSYPPAPVANQVEFNCPSCATLLRVGSELAGRPVKCPKCGGVASVPAPMPPSPMNMPSAPAWNPQSSAPQSFPQQNYPQQGYPQQGYQQPQSAPSFPTQPMQMPAPGGMPNSQQAPAGFQVTKSTEVTNKPRISAVHSGGEQTQAREMFERILSEINKVYVGQKELVLGTLVALFSSGHVLIESVPGLGKTLFVRTLGRVLGCKFGRIQFTADLMPSDITGAPIFDMKQQEFRFRAGPVFTQFLLADEINRSPAKTHAALLEIMQEYRVTIDGTSHPLERPFLVMATQNPIESEGTYNLPEAQLDRFMFKLIADYPIEEEENRILQMHGVQADINKKLIDDVSPITTPEEILKITEENSKVRIDDRLFDYINKLVRLTRKWPHFHMGASPRAGLAIVQATRTLAAFRGRDFAVPDDVADLALPALRHRVSLTAEAEVEGRKIDDLLIEMMRTVEVPRL
jgi:MoxR-like ATPase